METRIFLIHVHLCYPHHPRSHYCCTGQLKTNQSSENEHQNEKIYLFCTLLAMTLVFVQNGTLPCTQPISSLWTTTPAY